MPYPYYPLFNQRIDKRWTLSIYVDQQGNVTYSMTWIYGIFDLSTFRIRGKPSEILSKAISEINRILREVCANE